MKRKSFDEYKIMSLLCQWNYNEWISLSGAERKAFRKLFVSEYISDKVPFYNLKQVDQIIEDIFYLYNNYRKRCDSMLNKHIAKYKNDFFSYSTMVDFSIFQPAMVRKTLRLWEEELSKVKENQESIQTILEETEKEAEKRAKERFWKYVISAHAHEHVVVVVKNSYRPSKSNITAFETAIKDIKEGGCPCIGYMTSPQWIAFRVKDWNTVKLTHTIQELVFNWDHMTVEYKYI